MSTDDYSALRAEVAVRVNKARGTPTDMQERIRGLYFNDRLTAKEIATLLRISHGSVRSTISRAYSTMATEDRIRLGKHRGRWVEDVL